MLLVVAGTAAALVLGLLLPGMLWRKKLEHGGKVTVISGGSSGIGVALCAAACSQNAAAN